jgi:hypothetical protein
MSGSAPSLVHSNAFDGSSGDACRPNALFAVLRTPSVQQTTIDPFHMSLESD